MRVIATSGGAVGNPEGIMRLHAVLSLHFAQEEELYSLFDAN